VGNHCGVEAERTENEGTGHPSARTGWALHLASSSVRFARPGLEYCLVCLLYEFRKKRYMHDTFRNGFELRKDGVNRQARRNFSALLTSDAIG